MILAKVALRLFICSDEMTLLVIVVEVVVVMVMVLILVKVALPSLVLMK